MLPDKFGQRRAAAVKLEKLAAFITTNINMCRGDGIMGGGSRGKAGGHAST